MAKTRPPVEVQSVTLSESALSLTTGSTATLTATVLPANVPDKSVTWSVEPEGYAVLSAVSANPVTVTATAAGSATITATAGGKSASCKVTITAAEVVEEDVPGETPVYRLAAAKTFTPESKEYIDTGIQMFKSIDPKPSWTILFEVQYNESLAAAGSTYVLMHCMEETSPWPGFCVQVVGDGGLQANIYASKGGFASMSSLKADRLKFAVRIDGTTMTRWQSVGSYSDIPISGYTTAVDKSLLLGCFQESDGTKGRFFDGTLYQCIVYNKALTTEQITAWMA